MSLLRPQISPFCSRSEALPQAGWICGTSLQRPAARIGPRLALCVRVYTYARQTRQLEVPTLDAHHPDEEMLAQACHESAGEPREPWTSRTASSGMSSRAFIRSRYPLRPLRCASAVPARPPSRRPYHLADTDAAVRRVSTQWVQWTRNAFFSLETAWHGPYTISMENTP